MFVVIYTPGPAWQTVKTVEELPFFREHYKYMKQVFAARQLLMGGPFLDNQGALAFSMSRAKRRRGTSSPTIPLCGSGLLNLTCMNGLPTSISIEFGALKRGKLMRKRQSGEKEVRGSRATIEKGRHI